MKVAYLINQYPRVSHTFVRREIEALETLGVEVERYAIRGAPEALADQADRDEESRTRRILDGGYLGLTAAAARVAARFPTQFAEATKVAAQVGKLSDRGLAYHGAYLAEACVLFEWLEQSGAQHVHAHFGTNSATVAMLCRLLGGPPYSFTSHGPEEYDKPRLLALNTKVAHAKFVVAISHFGKSQLMRWSNLEDWPKLRIVRCGVDSSFVKNLPPAPSDCKRLVNIGRLHEQKGQLLLLEAARQVHEDGDNFELVFIGDGELRGEMERRIRDWKLQDKVQLLGWADSATIRTELERARALVLPSFAEGLPVVIMEALAMRRPVLTTMIAGIPELVDRENGWLVPAGSVPALVGAMKQALSASCEALGRMGTVGQERVADQHDVLKNAASLRDHFQA